MGELERNFMIMHTSSGAGENIIGDCNKIIEIHNILKICKSRIGDLAKSSGWSN